MPCSRNVRSNVAHQLLQRDGRCQGAAAAGCCHLPRAVTLPWMPPLPPAGAGAGPPAPPSDSSAAAPAARAASGPGTSAAAAPAAASAPAHRAASAPPLPSAPPQSPARRAGPCSRGVRGVFFKPRACLGKYSAFSITKTAQANPPGFFSYLPAAWSCRVRLNSVPSPTPYLRQKQQRQFVILCIYMHTQYIYVIYTTYICIYVIYAYT
jgi:hypothetical protein